MTGPQVFVVLAVAVAAIVIIGLIYLHGRRQVKRADRLIWVEDPATDHVYSTTPAQQARNAWSGHVEDALYAARQDRP